MEYRAGRAQPQTGADDNGDHERGRPGGVRALHIMGENPMMSEPNESHAT